MNRSAVEMARERWERGQRAFKELEAAKSHRAAEAAWSDFLEAASVVYSKLEQGAKGHGKSAGWFGRRKRERKDDDLLRYLHFARNSDSHGIERVVEEAPGTRHPQTGRLLEYNEVWSMEVQIHAPDGTPKGPPQPARVWGPTIGAVTAYDRRYGDSCEPPKVHRGQRMPFQHPFDIAWLALKYLDEMITEAETLIVD